MAEERRPAISETELGTRANDSARHQQRAAPLGTTLGLYDGADSFVTARSQGLCH